MRRSAIVTVAVIGAVATAAPAVAVPKGAPQLGDWWCTDAAGAPAATLEIFKGNKYAVDGGDKAKYVYKVGQKKMKFKTGDLSGDHYGAYDKTTKTLTLHAAADDAAWATCTQEAPVTEPAPEPLPEPTTP